MSVKDILHLIEIVSPDDEAKLNEIDARTHSYLQQEEFVEMTQSTGCVRHYKVRPTVDGDGGFRMCGYSHLYTRSRDALKSIRPDRFELTEWEYGHEYKFNLIAKIYPEVFYGGGASEELAELHCILQAIEYERSLELSIL